MLKAEFKRNIITKLAAALMMKGIKNIKQKFDYATKGGAPLLGVNGLVVKTHGNSKREQIYATILQTEQFIEDQLVEKIASKFS